MTESVFPKFTEHEIAKEQWVPFLGVHPRYEISNLGRVRTWKNSTPGELGASPVFMSIRSEKKNYGLTFGRVSVFKLDGRQTNRYIARSVLESFGVTGQGKGVEHVDGNTLNDRLSNLKRRDHRSSRAMMHPLLEAGKVPLIKKKCSACHVFKGLPFFNAQKGKGYGVSSACKKCSQKRAMDYINENRERVRANARARSRINRASRNASSQKWALNNRERVNSLSRKRRLERRQQDKSFAEYEKELNSKRRTLSKNQWIEKVDRGLVFEISKGKCCLCGGKLGDKWDLEHLTPVSRGGLHAYSNVGAAHPGCNQSKKDLTFEEWVNSTRFLNRISLWRNVSLPTY